jgi:RimJ/RimL family protein N-acetyltransferase
MIFSFRTVERNDSARVAKWKNDPYVQHMALNPGSEITLISQEEDIENYLLTKEGDYQIICCDGEAIGYVRIDWIDSEKRVAWLRFVLGEQRGKGFGTAALMQYCEQLMVEGCQRVEGEVYCINIASQRMLEKVGFKKEGIKRKAHFTGSEYVDIYVYGLIREDWFDK